MKFVIKDMLDRSLLKNKILVPVFTLVNLRDIIKETIEIMKFVALSKNLKIRLETDLKTFSMLKIDVNRV